MIKEKDFSEYKCVFSLNCKSHTLAIEYFKKGRLFYRASLYNIKTALAKRFIKDFDEKTAKEVYNYNMEVL